MMYKIISINKPDSVELLVKYEIIDNGDFNSFKTATEGYGYKVVLENNRFMVEKNKT